MCCILGVLSREVLLPDLLDYCISGRGWGCQPTSGQQSGAPWPCWPERAPLQSGSFRSSAQVWRLQEGARWSPAHCAKAGSSSPVPTPSRASHTVQHPRPDCGMSHHSWHARLRPVSNQFNNQRPAEVQNFKLPASEQPCFTRTLRQLFESRLNLLLKNKHK